MPVFHVTDPNGATYEVNAPDGATEQDALAYVQGQNNPQANLARMNENWDQNNPFNSGYAALVGAGKTLSGVGAGVKQIGLGADVAARQALGMNSGDQLRSLTALQNDQADQAARYAPLRQQFPFSTALGESLPLLSVPAGQATVAGRIAAPAIANAAIGALSYGSPEDRFNRAKTGLLTGAIGGAGGEAVRTVVAPAESTLNAAQQAALSNAMDKLGVQPRASQLSGSENIARLEDFLTRAPGGAGVMGDFISRNNAQVGKAAASAIGENAPSPTSDVLASASNRLGSTFDALRQNAAMPVSSNVTDAIDSAKAALSRGSTSGKGDALGMLQELQDRLMNTKALTGDEYQAWASDLSTAARQTNDRRIASALSSVKSAMDAEAQGASAPQWQQANKQWAALETLMKPNVTNAQTGEVNPVALARTMNSQFGKNMKTGQIQGPLADIANFGMALPPLREGSQTFGRQAFGTIPGWMQAPVNFALAKALTSRFGADYLSKGLLADPTISRAAAGLLGRAAVPAAIPFATSALLGMY